VVKLERELGPTAAAAQLQQRPVPVGGLIFQRDWFQSFCIEGCLLPHVHHTLPKQWDSLIQSWDFAFKGSEDSDFVVGQIWGRKGTDFYLLDQFRERTDFPGSLKAIKAMTAKWPRALAKLVEDKANGSAVVDTLKKDIRGIIPVEPQGGKVARANATAPLYAAKNVWHPDPIRCPWVVEHQNELIGFPKGRHDDSVDASSQALSYLNLSATRFLAAMEAVKTGL
jgi:predicted phage terminase large subunit-like protein